MKNKAIGFGNSDAKLVFYIRNRPPLSRYEKLTKVKALAADEISHICLETGNHWRKIFNVYAKLLFEMAPTQFSSWQHLRDNALLQAQSDHCLLFSTPDCSTANLADSKSSKTLHIILGKGYAEILGLCNDCTWLNNDFAINSRLGIIICPYFDYRQLSNKKINQLSGLIQQLSACEADITGHEVACKKDHLSA